MKLFLLCWAKPVVYHSLCSSLAKHLTIVNVRGKVAGTVINLCMSNFKIEINTDNDEIMATAYIRMYFLIYL